MKCQFCGADASVHMTDLATKPKREMHLCDGCARQHGVLPTAPGPQLNLHALLHLIMTQGGPRPTSTTDPDTLRCPECGLGYPQFRADGRLGCPHDYDAFRPALEPLLERVHRGLVHAGKVPTAVRRQRQTADRQELEAALRAAVAAEQYEEAARLRDRLKDEDAA